MHLVGSIIRIYHDARSPERQRRLSSRLYSHFQVSGRHYTEKITITYITLTVGILTLQTHRLSPTYAPSDLGNLKIIGITFLKRTTNFPFRE